MIDELNDRYFAGELSTAVLAQLAPIDGERPEVQQFVTRMFEQMRLQRLPATDFAEFPAWVTGKFIPRILPGAWGGSVPPITHRGRHAAIDEYLARNEWRALADGDRLLDLGCGFPPATTIDTAERFGQVAVTGADPSFGKYLVTDANGSYAVFDGARQLLYFQPGSNTLEHWDALYTDPEATRTRFTGGLDALHPLLSADRNAFESVEKDGVTVARNPVQRFTRPNLTFTQAGIGSDALTGFETVRCFNVLIYFDDAFRQRALEWLAGVLVEGGLCVSGANWTGSRHARYSVHRLENGVIVPKEFAFGIDNFRSLEVVSFFALHDDDHDLNLMSKLIGTLRGDSEFAAAIDRRIDELLADLGFCARKPDGYLGGVSPDADRQLLQTASELIGSALERDGFHQRAAEVLCRNGYRAWVNCVGHVAIDPARP